MPRSKISEYSATANSNTDVAGINVDEGCAPSGINNAIRAVMGHLKDFQSGTNADPFNGPVNGTLGATTPASAAVTTLTTSSTVTHNGGTANGVAYLNGSKVLTTGSALQFDGTNLGLGVTPSAWNSANKVLQFAYAGTVAGGTTLDLYCNAYVNSGGTSKYIDSYAYASKYTQYNGVHQWHNTSSTQGAGNTVTWSQAMTLDASGNLVVGATTANTYGGRPSVQIGQGTDGGVLNFQGGTTSTTNAAHIRINTSGTTVTDFVIETRNQAGTSSTPIVFKTQETERARIDSSGNLLVGTTATINAAKALVAFSSSNNGLYVQDSTGVSAAQFMRFDSTSNTCGSITRVGTTSAVTYNATSDYRLKTVIGSVSGHGERIDALEPIEYEWKIDGSRTRGFLAHKFQEVYANSVTGEKDAVDAEGNPVYQSMQASSAEVIADLVAELQSLRQRLAAAKI